MSDGKAPLSDIRINLGYIKPGEQYNKPLFWGNVIIFISLVILVAFLFTCHNKRDASSNLQDRDLMYFAILSAVILGFFALPINIWDGLYYYRKGVYSVSRHPIYAFLLVLSGLLLISVGIYYATEGKNESSQKTLLILSMILLGIIIIACLLLFWIVNYPYGWWARLFKAQVLGDEELYAINSDLFNSYVLARKRNEILTKYMEKGGTLSSEEAKSLGVDKDMANKLQRSDYNYIKNDSTGNSITTLNTILALSATSKKESYDYKAQLYNLGDFKNEFNYAVLKAEKLDEYNKAGRKELIFKKFMELRTKKYFFKDAKLPEKPMKDLAEAIKKSDDGRITAQQYSEIFGYYDNMTGVTNPGVYQNVKDITKKYEDSVVNGFTSEFQGRIALKYKNTINDWDGVTYSNDFEPAIKKYASANINFIKKEGIEKSVDKLIINMASANCDADGKKIDKDPDITQRDAQKMKNDGTLVNHTKKIMNGLIDCMNKAAPLN
jgi:protein-S-isoprenylcysteine O-methyltransferase Ste14